MRSAIPYFASSRSVSRNPGIADTAGLAACSLFEPVKAKRPRRTRAPAKLAAVWFGCEVAAAASPRCRSQSPVLLQRIGNLGDARIGARFVFLAARRTRHADAPDQLVARLDRHAAADADNARDLFQESESRILHLLH